MSSRSRRGTKLIRLTKDVEEGDAGKTLHTWIGVGVATFTPDDVVLLVVLEDATPELVDKCVLIEVVCCVVVQWLMPQSSTEGELRPRHPHADVVVGFQISAAGS